MFVLHSLFLPNFLQSFINKKNVENAIVFMEVLDDLFKAQLQGDIKTSCLFAQSVIKKKCFPK